jgi:hypothetical protein
MLSLINVENIFIFIFGFIIGFLFPIIKRFKNFVENEYEKKNKV